MEGTNLSNFVNKEYLIGLLEKDLTVADFQNLFKRHIFENDWVKIWSDVPNARDRPSTSIQSCVAKALTRLSKNQESLLSPHLNVAAGWLGALNLSFKGLLVMYLKSEDDLEEQLSVANNKKMV